MKKHVSWEVSKDLSPRQKKIAKALNERGANLPCPRCGSTDFSVFEDYVSHLLTRDLRSLTSKSIPTAVTICIKCGYVCEHALVVLQLMPKKDKKETQQ